jgi:hypothetical protein
MAVLQARIWTLQERQLGDRIAVRADGRGLTAAAAGR